MSKTDNENTEPRRANPSNDTDEPKREKLRRAKDAPNVLKSITDKADPILEKLRSDRDAPK
jgi:hypothetical protein